MCGKHGPRNLDCWHRFDQEYQFSTHSSSSSMSAMMTSPYTTFDPNWYPDLGATNHVISDPNNLTTEMNYTGTDQVHVGNGSGLNIQLVSSSSFLSLLIPKLFP